MAEGKEVFDVYAKLESLKLEIIRTFEELHKSLIERRDDLLSRLARMREVYEVNVTLDEAINQLRITTDSILGTMSSNLIGESRDEMKATLDRDIDLKLAEKVAVENLEFVEFRCCSGRIRKAIEETDLIKLIPEYVGRESPVLKRCPVGSIKGEFSNPGGIAINRTTNEVFIADKNNSRIQVLTVDGEYLRSFESRHLKEPWDICVSRDAVFVTDLAKECLLMFSLAGKFINKTGCRGNLPGCFTGIRGLCCIAGFVYVCECNIQRIQVFDIQLQFIRQFGVGQIKLPTSITVYSDTIHILSQDQNSIYCYHRSGTYLKKIELTGQQQMTLALFFTIDKRGNFLITDQMINEIRIFSPDGVLKHILGRGHHRTLSGIQLDNSNDIICVCHGAGKDCFQKY